MNLIERLTFDKIQSTVLKKGYPFFTKGDFNLNLIGIRAMNKKSNRFDDVFCVLYYVQGNPKMYVFNATTDPGLHYLKHPMHKDGCAILHTGHHNGLWKVGTHRGTYKALQQKNAAYFYRDNDRDAFVDDRLGELFRSRIGLNCHRAHKTFLATDVDKWSAGCQVIANPHDFALLIQLCEISAERFGNSFSYTLLNEKDLLC